jgi:hypothetical protein
MITYPGEDGRTIDVNTGLAYPTKAERARNNPRVCLLYSEPNGTTVEKPPVVLIYGQASVYDSDLQANTDRVVQGYLARMRILSKIPPFMLRFMTAYLARIWIAVTPLKVLWWSEGDMSKTPQQWHASQGTEAPPSDPKPELLGNPHKRLNLPQKEWQEDIAYALDQLGTPVLTVVDGEGYPVPFRARSGSLRSNGVHLDLLSAMPTEAKGRACLTFHTIQVKNGEMVSNENLSFLGEVSGDVDSVLFKIERPLPGVSLKVNPTGILNLVQIMLGFRKRLEVEAGRRGQPVPVVRLPQ